MNVDQPRGRTGEPELARKWNRHGIIAASNAILRIASARAAFGRPAVREIRHSSISRFRSGTLAMRGTVAPSSRVLRLCSRSFSRLQQAPTPERKPRLRQS